MKKLLFFLLSTNGRVFSAPLICTICSVGVASGFGIAKFFGISNEVIGLWLGACLFLFYQWSRYFLDKKQINGKLADFAILLASHLILVSFYVGKNPPIVYNSKRFLFIDSFLFFNVLGSFVLFYSGKYYQYMKEKNGKPHFQFEKVILPLSTLIIVSLLIKFLI